jgi:hypothetical protein
MKTAWNPLGVVNAALQRYQTARATRHPGLPEMKELRAAMFQLYDVHGAPLGEQGLRIWLRYETWTTIN